MALRITDTLDDTTIARQLGSCRLVTLAAPSYLAKQGVPKQPQDLYQHACLGYFSQATNKPWQYLIDGQLENFYFTSSLQANNGDALAQAAAKGMGLVLVPSFIAAKYVQTGQLEEVLADYAPPALGIYAVLASNRFIPLRLASLLDFLTLKLATSPGW